MTTNYERLLHRLVLAVVGHLRELATGKSAGGYIKNGNWQQIEPQSVNPALWDRACKNHTRHGRTIFAVPILSLLSYTS
ncbi:MAG: hypothetical protein HP491_16505 [Nitrospira sp.]|nr:hypothetical protein [Nitrospira sp.]